MANSVNIPISLSLQSEDIVKEYKQAMQKMSNVSDLKNQFTEMLKLQAQYIANAEKIKDPLSKALNLQSAKEYSRLLNDIQNQVKKIDRDRLPEFEIPEIKFDNKQIINSFKGIDSEIQTIIDNIGTMNTMLGKSNVSEIFKGVGETQVTEYYKNIVALRKDIIKEEIKSGKVSSQSIENLLSVLQEAEVYQNRILQKNGKISDITKLLPKSIIDNEAFSKIMNRESLEVRWKEITMPGFVDNVRNAIMTKITQIATGEDFKLPTIGLEMDIDVANSFGEYQKKIDMATERLKKLVAKFYQTNEFRTDFQNLGISDDKSKTLNYYKLIFDIKSTMEEIETLSGAIGKSTKNIYGKKGLSGLVLNDYFSPDGDEYLGFNSIYEDLNSPKNSKYLQIFKEKLISNISNGYKNVMATVENETQDSLTKQLESINKILYTASDASYINNTSVEDEINSIIKSDDQAYTKLLNKRNEIISKLTDQGYEIESAVTDGIHGLVESNEIKKGKKVEFGRRKNNNNNNINNVGSGSDSNATTNDKSFEEIDRRISDIEQEVQNIKQRIETIGGEDKSNNNRVVDALQTQINELKNTVKNISGGGASTKEIEDSLKKMQQDILEITEKIIGQETLGVLRQNLDAVTAQINGLATINQITQLQSQLEKVNQIVTLLDDNLKSINSRLNQMALNTPNSQNTSVSTPTTNSESVNQEADAYEKLNQIYAKYNELQNTHYEEEQFELRKKRLAQLKEYRIQLHELAKQIGEDDERVKDLTVKDGDKSLSLFSDEMTRNNIDERISELSRRQQDAINKKFDEFNKVKNRLNEIAPNGVVSESNLVAFEAIVEYIKQLLDTISNSEIYGDTTSFQNDVTNLMNKAQNMTLPKKKTQTVPQRKKKQNNSSATSESKPSNNTRSDTTSEEANAIINSLKTRIAALETKLNTLDRAKRDTKSRLTALEQTTGTNNASTKALAKKSELDTINNEIKEIRETINSLQTLIDKITTNGISSVDSNLDINGLVKYAEALSLVTTSLSNVDPTKAEVITKAFGTLSKALKDYETVNKSIELPEINGDIAQIDSIIPKMNELTKSLKEFKAAVTGIANSSVIGGLDNLIEKLRNLSTSGKIDLQISNVKSVNEEIDKFSKMVIEWAEAIQIQKKAGANEVERVALFNSKNGFLSNSYVSDKNDEVRDAVNREMLKRYQKEKVDTHIHSHPENIAAFSFDDLNNHIKRLEYGITKNLVVASKEVMKIDLSGVTDKNEYTQFISELQQKIISQMNDFLYNQLKDISANKIANQTSVKYWAKQISNRAIPKSGISINDEILSDIDAKLYDYFNNFINSLHPSNTKSTSLYEGLMETYNNTINELTANGKNSELLKYKDRLYNAISKEILQTFRTQSGIVSEDEYATAQKKFLLDGFRDSKYANVLSVMSIEDFKKNNPALSQITQSQENQSSDNTKLDEIIRELKNISQKMNTSTTKASNNASPNISANQSPNNTPSSVISPSISSEGQAASEATTAEVTAFTTIDDAVTGLTGHINTKTEAIRAEATEMVKASQIETSQIGKIVNGVIKLKEEIKSIPKISVTGKNTKAEPIKITAEISDEQIAKIRQRVLDAFGEKNPIPIFFKPNVQSIKKQINDGLKDGLEKLTIQSFDFENAAKDMKKTLAKAMSDVGLQFDTKKLRLDIKTAVNAARDAAESAGRGNPSITASGRKNAKGGNIDPKKLDRLYTSFERDVTSYYNRNTLILRDQEVNDLFSKILNDVKKQPKSKENLDVLYRRFSEAQIAAINKGLDFNADKSDIGTAVIHKGYETLISQINKYLETNTKIIGSQFEEEFSKLLSEASKPAQARTDVDLKQLGAEFARLKNYVDEAGLSGNADNEAKKVSKLDRGYATLALDMKKFHEENNKLDKSTEWADKFNKLFNNITGSISRSEVELEDFRAQFANFKNEIPRDLLGSTVTSEFFENLKGYDIDSIAKIFEKQSGQVKSRLLNDKYGFESPKMTRDISQMLDAQADRLSGLINQENVSDNDIDGIVQHNKQMNNLIDTYQTYSEKRRELQELVSKDSSNEELKRLLQESDALSNSQVYDVQAMKSWSDSYVEAVNNLKTAQSNSEKEQRSSRATSTQQNQYRALTKDIEEATATAQRFKEQYAGLLSDGLNNELNKVIGDMSARSSISVDLSNSSEITTWNDESKKLLDTWTAIQERIKSSVVASGQAGEVITATMDYSQYTRKATNALSNLNSKYKDKLTDKQSAEFEQRLEAIRNKVKEISDDTSKYTANNVQVIETDIQQLEKLAKDFEVVQNSENKINSLIRTLSNSRNSIERRGSTAQPVVNSIDSEKAALEELKRQGQNLDIGNPESVRAFVEKLNEADTTVNKLKNDAEQIRISTNTTASVAKLDSKFNDLLFKVDKFKRDNSKITSDKGISAQFDSLMRSIQTIEKSDVNFQRLRAQFDQLKATVQGKGLTGRSLGDELKYIAEKIGIKAMLGNSIYRVIGAFRQMVGIVTELDTGMTTLKRVTEETEATYRKFLKTAGDEAHELGSTVSGLVDSTGDFARLGYNIQEANALAKNAVMYSNVGWLDIETATADMTSTMKAFNIEASDSIRIVDTFDILGKKLPLVTISVKGWRHSRPSKDIVNHNICVTTAGGVW